MYIRFVCGSWCGLLVWCGWSNVYAYMCTYVCVRRHAIMLMYIRMYICMYIYMYICMCTAMLMWLASLIWVEACMCTYVYICTCTYVRVCIWGLCVHICVYMYVYVCLCMLTWVYVRLSMYMYVCICIYSSAAVLSWFGVGGRSMYVYSSAHSKATSKFSHIEIQSHWNSVTFKLG